VVESEARNRGLWVRTCRDQVIITINGEAKVRDLSLWRYILLRILGSCARYMQYCVDRDVSGKPS
jgi:hypothetical protein